MAKILLISTLILFFYGLEASPTDEDKKLWAVFDYPVVEGKPPPSCMLAHFNANFNLHHGLFGKENETNFLNLLKNADVTNHTCHTGWEEKKQKLILTPTNYSEHVFKLSFHFKQSEDENGLIHNALDRVNLKLMLNTTNGVYVMSGHSNRSLNLMTVPALYAFVCKRPYTISMKVKLYKFEDEEGISEQSLSEFVLDESSLSPNFDPYNTTELHTTGDLTLSDVKLELFRELRFYEDITHLKYLCDVNWPYKWVPFAVFGFVFSFALACVGVFGYRYKSEKRVVKI